MMQTRTLRLVDPAGRVIAREAVSDQIEHFGGTVDLSDTPADLRSLFNEFEEVVNGQMLSLVDEFEERIAALQLRAVFNDGFEAPVRDLQVFPGSGTISFCVVEFPAHAGASRRGEV